MRNKVVALAACLVMMGAGMLWAEDAKTESKEVTLKGTQVCAKCNLKEADACQDVLEVKDGDKTVKYYMTKDKSFKHQCSGSKENVTVTGTVTEKDGKKWVKVTKAE